LVDWRLDKVKLFVLCLPCVCFPFLVFVCWSAFPEFLGLWMGKKEGVSPFFFRTHTSLHFPRPQPLKHSKIDWQSLCYSCCCWYPATGVEKGNAGYMYPFIHPSRVSMIFRQTFHFDFVWISAGPHSGRFSFFPDVEFNEFEEYFSASLTNKWGGWRWGGGTHTHVCIANPKTKRPLFQLFWYPKNSAYL